MATKTSKPETLEETPPSAKMTSAQLVKLTEKQREYLIQRVNQIHKRLDAQLKQEYNGKLVPKNELTFFSVAEQILDKKIKLRSDAEILKLVKEFVDHSVDRQIKTDKQNHGYGYSVNSTTLNQMSSFDINKLFNWELIEKMNKEREEKQNTIRQQFAKQELELRLHADSLIDKLWLLDMTKDGESMLNEIQKYELTQI